jgi:CYTH domain-containing protein
VTAPIGQPDKYARVERERRFLLRSIPEDPPAVRVREIEDRYFPGTRLRLRRVHAPGGQAETEYKLTQKIRFDEPGAVQGLITNTYLSQTEYELLARLPGHILRKTRYSMPPIGIDVFGPPLDGLALAEAEFATDEQLAAFVPPDYALKEVTADRRFTGGRLARTTHDELAALLSEFGLEID